MVFVCDETTLLLSSVLTWLVDGCTRCSSSVQWKGSLLSLKVHSRGGGDSELKGMVVTVVLLLLILLLSLLLLGTM